MNIDRTAVEPKTELLNLNSRNELYCSAYGKDMGVLPLRQGEKETMNLP